MVIGTRIVNDYGLAEMLFGALVVRENKYVDFTNKSEMKPLISLYLGRRAYEIYIPALS
jgi:hypothetical protein